MIISIRVKIEEGYYSRSFTLTRHDMILEKLVNWITSDLSSISPEGGENIHIARNPTCHFAHIKGVGTLEITHEEYLNIGDQIQREVESEKSLRDTEIGSTKSAISDCEVAINNCEMAIIKGTREHKICIGCVQDGNCGFQKRNEVEHCRAEKLYEVFQ